MRKKSLVGWTYNQWYLKWYKRGYAGASRLFKKKGEVVGNEIFPVNEPYPQKVRITIEEIN